jgi:hypothetical protein
VTSTKHEKLPEIEKLEPVSVYPVALTAPELTTSDDRNGATVPVDETVPFSLSDWTDEEQGYAPSEQHALVPVSPDLQTISIPEDATIEERLSLMAFMGDTLSLWHQAGETLTFVGIQVVNAFKRDENGAFVLDDEDAPVPCKLTLWKTEDGKLYRAQSPVAYGFCRDKVWPVMTAHNKPGMLLAPVSIKIGHKLTRNGKQTFKFDVVG